MGNDFILISVNSVAATAVAGFLALNVSFKQGEDGETITGPFGYSPDDNQGLSPLLHQWFIDNEGKYTVAPYVPPPPAPYQIAKTTPWLRMTEDEADQIYAAMQLTNARLRGIYDAATFLSSGDALWSTLHDMIAGIVGNARADQILAPEN